MAKQGLDVLIIVDHRGWVERGGLLHDAINLEKLSTLIVGAACHICTEQFISKCVIEVRSDKLLVLECALAVFFIMHMRGNPRCNEQ